MIVYPKTDLPSAIQFLPTGGPNSGPAFKLDGAGADPTILAIRKPLAKLSDWSTSVEYLVDTSAMAVADNGYEGCGVRSRLLKQGTTEPYSIYDSGLLNGTSDDWHTKQDTWHTVSQRLDYGIAEQPEVEDIQFVVKAPVGNSAKIAQLSVINQYSRFYEAAVTGESSALAMTRLEFQTITWQLNLETLRGEPVTATRTSWIHYMNTIPTNIQAGESVKMTFSGVLNLTSGSDFDLPVTLKASVKYTTAAGEELWKDIVSHESYDEEIPDTLIEGSNEFLANEDYPQAELVITIQTKYGYDYSKTLGHKGMHFSLTTSRPIVSTNG